MDVIWQTLPEHMPLAFVPSLLQTAEMTSRSGIANFVILLWSESWAKAAESALRCFGWRG